MAFGNGRNDYNDCCGIIFRFDGINTTMRFTFLLIIFCVVFLLGTACNNPTNKGSKDMKTIFADMENGIKNQDENMFKKHWHPDGYSENLVGGSGLAGNRVFEQGSRKKWFLKPNLEKTETVDKVEIVETEIYAWERDKTVDEIHLAIAEGKILGGGEDLSEVKSLAERFNSGQALSPK